MKFFKALDKVLKGIPLWLAVFTMCIAFVNIFASSTGLLIWIWMFIVIEFIVGYERSKSWA